MNLDEIKARCEAATEGPWTWQDLILRQERQYGAMIVELGSGVLAAEVNCDFIAHAREDVPGLVAEVERLRTAVLEMRLLTPEEAADRVCAALDRLPSYRLPGANLSIDLHAALAAARKALEVGNG